MKQDNDFLKKIGNDDGMTVPDGYFADFAQRMAQQLPQIEFENTSAPKVLPRSRWQQVRPYVYLAAMFMGIWCMMKMFNLMASTDTNSLDSNPTLISAITDDSFFDDYCCVDGYDVLEDMYNEGFSTTDFVELASHK